MQGGGGSSLNRTSASLRGAIATKQSSDPQGRQCSSGVCHWLTQLRCAGLPRSRWSLAMTPGVNRVPYGTMVCGFAFTMAEILLSLTIIGVVAAITLPSLTGNINERTWNTQRKALYARMSQAISLMPALNGYSDSETFVAAGLSKVLKINNICDYDHVIDCGITSKNITDIKGSQMLMPKKLSELNSKNTSVSYEGDRLYTYNMPDSEAVAFETANGESLLAFYNPNCQSDMNETGSFYIQPKMCANFVYDLNGNKGPNTVGKDIGVITVLYPSDSVVVAPVVYNYNASSSSIVYREALQLCKTQGDDYRMPNRHELMSMFYNNNLFKFSNAYWSSSSKTKYEAWIQSFITGLSRGQAKNDASDCCAVRCIKR